MVQYFVNPDSVNEIQAFEDHPKATAIRNILKQLTAASHQLQSFCAVIINLRKQRAMTDLVLITECGMGVVELNPTPGSISMRGTTWYAGSTPIPGDAEVGYRNPHEQVQMYAEVIRTQLIDARNVLNLQTSTSELKRFQFSTAVCFTHPDVRFDRFPAWHYQKSPKNPHIQPWEQFSILTPAELPGWADALCFGMKKSADETFEPYRLTPEEIGRIVRELFGATDWAEIEKLT